MIVEWRRKIAAAEADIARLEAEIKRVRRELDAFKAQYDLIVEPISLRVESVRAAIREYHQAGAASFVPDEPRIPPEPSHASLDPLADDIKALYRELARRYHPDHARDDDDRDYRNRVMATVNAAYAERNVSAMQALAAQETRIDPDESLVQTEQRWLKRRYNLLRERVFVLKEELHALLTCDLMQLKTQARVTEMMRRDLLHELAADFEVEYRRLIKQLFDLRSNVV